MDVGHVPRVATMHVAPDASPVLSRRSLIGSAAGTAAVALAGCMRGSDRADADTGDPGTAAGSGGSLRYAQPASFVDLDPIVLNDVLSGEIAQQIFEGPYEYESDLSMVPRLASEAPTVEREGRRWIVPLDPAATFQHGEPVTAGDVAYSYRAPMAEATANAGEVNMIADVTPIDEGTVQFDLEFPFAAFQHYLGRAVVPEAVREEDREAFNTEQPLGSGPFELQRATQGESATLTRWDDYWGEQSPNLAEITFVPATEGTTRITTLSTGENDVVKSIPPTDWETVRGMDDARIESTLGVNYVYLAFNCAAGPTADPQVREAIDYAVSMDRAVSRFIDPAGERVHAPIPRALADAWDFPVEEWRAIGHERDVDRAKALLDDASAVPDDWSATIIVPPDDAREDVAVSVANGIRETGYDASVRQLDVPTFGQRYTSGDPDDYDMYALGWSGAPDPDTFMYFLFGQESIGSTNGTHYRDEALEAAILEARQSTDRATRRRRYDEAVRHVLEARVHLPAYTRAISFGVRSHVRDWLAHPIAQFSITSPENNVAIQ